MGYGETGQGKIWRDILEEDGIGRNRGGWDREVGLEGIAQDGIAQDKIVLDRTVLEGSSLQFLQVWKLCQIGEEDLRRPAFGKAYDGGVGSEVTESVAIEH